MNPDPKIIKPSHLMMHRYGVMVSGCFDLLHIGHIRYLKWARKLLMSGPLVVSLTADKFITHKGPGRPAFDENIRAESLAALECVDFVAIINEPTALEAIQYAHPAIYAKGHDWLERGLDKTETDAVEEHGGRICFMPKEDTRYSSGSILSGEYLKSRVS